MNHYYTGISLTSKQVLLMLHRHFSKIFVVSVLRVFLEHTFISRVIEDKAGRKEGNGAMPDELKAINVGKKIKQKRYQMSDEYLIFCWKSVL